MYFFSFSFLSFSTTIPGWVGGWLSSDYKANLSPADLATASRCLTGLGWAELGNKISIAPPGYEFGLGQSLAIINHLRWLPRGELDNPQIENNGNHDLGLSIWRVDMLKCFFVLWSKQTRNDLSEIWLLDVHSQYNCGPIIFSGPTDIEKTTLSLSVSTFYD